MAADDDKKTCTTGNLAQHEIMSLGEFKLSYLPSNQHVKESFPNQNVYIEKTRRHTGK